MTGIRPIRAAGRLGALVLVLGVAACAAPREGGTAADGSAIDPLEPVNRPIFEFNMALDKAVLRPTARAYSHVPAPMRGRVGDFLGNLSAPLWMVNQGLQGRFGEAAETGFWFLINSTIGFGGLVDLAEAEGITRHDEDFGQTLAVWGVSDGAYLMLPILGPSNVRDGVGRAVDAFMDPFPRHVEDGTSYARTGVKAIHKREQLLGKLERMEETSVDFYAAVRSLYRQNRGDEIRNGAPDPAGSGANYDLEEMLEQSEPAGEEPQ